MVKTTAENVSEGVDASELTIIVTGATNGVGRETARVLAKRGARVILASRSESAMEKVKAEITKETPGARVDLLELDLSSMTSVRAAAQRFLDLDEPLNVLVNNAGMIPFQGFKLSPDGIESTFATNYVGPFLFTALLQDTMIRTARETGVEGRIVNVSSKAAGWKVHPEEGIGLDSINDETKFSVIRHYGQSKLAQILYTQELDERLKAQDANVMVNSLHPGVVKTNLVGTAQWWMKPFLLLTNLFSVGVDEGAATQTYLAISPDVKGVTGKYFENAKEIPMTYKYASDKDLQKRLWDFSVKATSGSEVSK